MPPFTKIPNSPGTSNELDALKEKLQQVFDLVESKLEALASNLTSELDPELIDVLAKTRVMIPPIPSIPDINLQAEIANLAALSPSSGEYAAKLASIKTSFGAAISAGGYDLDSIVSDGVAALNSDIGSLAASIPNMVISDELAGLSIATEISKASLQAIDPVQPEAAPSFSRGESFDSITGLGGDGYAADRTAESFDNLILNMSEKLEWASKNPGEYEGPITEAEERESN
jgi:hypothetical protein